MCLYSLKQGDCLELMRDIPDKSIDMVLCDLPYGTTDNQWDKQLPLNDLWAQYKRIVKDNGAICLFAQMPFAALLGASNLKMLKYQWIWKKGNRMSGFLNAKKMPLKNHEQILVFYKRLPTYNPQRRTGFPNYSRKAGRNSTNYDCVKNHVIITAVGDGTRYPIDVLEFDLERGLHPTQKPVALCEYLIKTYTNEGETVLDNCMGSGTTGVACLNTGRKFIGFELDETYFKLAAKRLGNV